MQAAALALLAIVLAILLGCASAVCYVFVCNRKVLPDPKRRDSKKEDDKVSWQQELCKIAESLWLQCLSPLAPITPSQIEIHTIPEFEGSIGLPILEEKRPQVPTTLN